MRVPDATLNELRARGYCLMEGFLDATELAAAQAALWLHFPPPEDYFADPVAHGHYATSQFAGVLKFPYRSWDLNGLAVHPDLIDAVERYLQTAELHLYKIELWGKYAGAVNYDQPLHRDYGSHSLVVPRPRAPLSADHDVRLPVGRHRGRRPNRDRPLRRREGGPVLPALSAVRFADRPARCAASDRQGPC